jgi:hypothetical protein
MKTSRLKTVAALCLTALGSSMLAAPLRSARAGAWGESIVSAEAIQKSLRDYYCAFPNQPASEGCKPTAGLLQDDVREWALAIFDQIALLETGPFNQVLLALRRDYATVPSRRPAIVLLLGMLDVKASAGNATADAMRQRLRNELYGRRTQNKTLDILDKAFTTLMVAYAVQGIVVGGPKAYRGWRSGSAGLGMLDRTQRALHDVLGELKYLNEAKNIAPMLRLAARLGLISLQEYRSLRKGADLTVSLGTAARLKAVRSTAKLLHDKRTQLFAAGATLGAIELAANPYLQTHKLDPATLLEPIQKVLVEEAALDAAYYRDEMRPLLKLDEGQLLERSKDLREKMTEIDAGITRVETEMGHFYDNTPELRPQMEPIAQDLSEARDIIQVIHRRINQVRLQENLKNDEPIEDGDLEELGAGAAGSKLP